MIENGRECWCSDRCFAWRMIRLKWPLRPQATLEQRLRLIELSIFASLNLVPPVEEGEFVIFGQFSEDRLLTFDFREKPWVQRFGFQGVDAHACRAFHDKGHGWDSQHLD